ncbi:flagellar motor switch protein FliM [Tepidamorphus gemmatus]|uniref:Flagellar motor switch protein FliM n=1 Tax=Tepidamorphus gemmatus TaxID=747076 RepID=A0A4V6NZK8_9HYPH|nr:flagellar motor switch protein FliM [Tepidamorphus gemmatus]TCT06478.1 flagellar motor switch protein FliM [Tepidamorphus gemmatus]
MAGDDDIDQDALAAEWGVSLDDEEGASGDDAMADKWAAMIDEEEPEAVASAGTERVLNQEEIDSLLGFNVEGMNRDVRNGIRAIINSTIVSYERLPMLEIVFDRLVRLLTTSLRNFTSDNVEVALEGLSSVRFGDYLNSIPLPAILAVFKAEEWDNYGLVTVGSNLIYSMVDVLLGGGRGSMRLRIEGRPYTTIEMNLIRRMIEVVLGDADLAFAPLSPVHFNVERLETNPRFAAIARPANAAILVKLRIDMEDRGGNIEILLPYATIEPIRELLLQMFMGEKFGRDPIWEGHLASELWSATVELDAVLFEQEMPLRKVMDFKVGDTLALDRRTSDPIILRCGETVLTEGKAGRVGDKVAVRITSRLRRPKMTYAAFEKADRMAVEGT